MINAYKMIIPPTRPTRIFLKNGTADSIKEAIIIDEINTKTRSLKYQTKAKPAHTKPNLKKVPVDIDIVFPLGSNMPTS